MDPLPDTLNPDGKSLYNPPTDVKSTAYDHFPHPIDPSNNGFDFHSELFRLSPYLARPCRSQVYYMHTVPSEIQFARELHQRIRREFPEVSLSSF